MKLLKAYPLAWKDYISNLEDLSIFVTGHSTKKIKRMISLNIDNLPYLLRLKLLKLSGESDANFFYKVDQATEPQCEDSYTNLWDYYHETINNLMPKLGNVIHSNNLIQVINSHTYLDLLTFGTILQNMEFNKKVMKPKTFIDIHSSLTSEKQKHDFPDISLNIDQRGLEFPDDLDIPMTSYDLIKFGKIFHNCLGEATVISSILKKEYIIIIDTKNNICINCDYEGRIIQIFGKCNTLVEGHVAFSYQHELSQIFKKKGITKDV